MLRKCRRNKGSAGMESSNSSDWRMVAKSLREKMNYILSHSIVTDLTIRVICDKPLEFQVHSIFLIMASEVFEKMITSNFKEGTSKIITISDIKPKIFNLMLQHIYGQRIDFDDIQQAWELFAVADYYFIHDLKALCIDYIGMTKDPSSACSCIEMAENYDLPNLKEQKLQIIRKKTKDVVTDKNFLEAKVETVELILEQNQLNISEFELFKAFECWINSAVRKGEEINALICERLIPKFRFFSMTVKEFTDGPLNSSLMNKDDVIAVIGNMTSADCVFPLPEGFVRTKRIRSNEVTTDRLPRCIEHFGVNQVLVSVNKNLTIKGISIFTQEADENHTYIEEVWVRFGPNGCRSWENSTQFKGEVPHSSILYISLSEPYKLVKDFKYEMSIQTVQGAHEIVNMKDVCIQNDDLSLSFFQYRTNSFQLPLASIMFDY